MIAALVGSLDMGVPVTMANLWPQLGAIFLFLLATLLGIGKWFITNQLTDKINRLSDDMSEVKTELAVIKEHVTGIERVCTVRHK